MKFKSIKYGNSRIDFQIFYKERKTLGIKVNPDGAVIVSAPMEATLESIIEKVKKRAEWIFRQKLFFMLFEPRAIEKIYESGEGHLYLGRMYRLMISENKNKSIKLKGSYIWIETKDRKNKESIKKELNDWYKVKASIHFNQLYDQRLKIAKELTDKETTLKYKWYTSRWGSCFKDGTISLNLELIKAPKECIDYVIVHEMCHLAHHNHSAKFYNLLDKKLPKWRDSKAKLEKLLA